MKVSPSFVVGAVAVAGLLAFGIVRTLAGDTDEVISDDRDDAQSERARPRAAGSKRGVGMSPVARRGLPPELFQGGDARIDQLPPNPIPGEIGANEAAEVFAEAMAALDGALESDDALTTREKGDLYNQASGAFTVLSRHTNMTDPTERVLLEEAYGQMRTRMAALELAPAEEIPLPQEFGMPPPAPAPVPAPG